MYRISFCRPAYSSDYLTYTNIVDPPGCVKRLALLRPFLSRRAYPVPGRIFSYQTIYEGRNRLSQLCLYLASRVAPVKSLGINGTP